MWKIFLHGFVCLGGFEVVVSFVFVYRNADLFSFHWLPGRIMLTNKELYGKGADNRKTLGES